MKADILNLEGKKTKSICDMDCCEGELEMLTETDYGIEFGSLIRTEIHKCNSCATFYENKKIYDPKTNIWSDSKLLYEPMLTDEELIELAPQCTGEIAREDEQRVILTREPIK